MKPALLCIDANAGTVARYAPKRGTAGGFLRDRFAIEPEALPVLGDASRRADLETMRAGNGAQNVNVPSTRGRA